MYQRILAAIDETDSATRAAHEAVALARHAGSQVLFLNVGASGAGEGALASARALAQWAGVDAKTARVAADGDGIGEAIVREAERWSADLIVVGRHNRGAMERLLLGSVSAAVVRASEIPVLLVRRPSPPARKP